MPAPGNLTLLLLPALIDAGLPAPLLEFRFCKPRRFRWDLCWPARMVAVELDGAIWRGRKGGHTGGKGYERMCVKQNLGTAVGWRVLRFTTAMVESGEAVRVIRRVLEVG